MKENESGEQDRRITMGDVSVAVAASTPIMYELARIVDTRETLSEPRWGRTVLEPCDHAGLFGGDKIERRFRLENDPDAHILYASEGMKKRFADSLPEVVTLDSLGSVHEREGGQKNELWLNLPCRPSEINSNGIYVVGGDNFSLSAITDWDAMLKHKLSYWTSALTSSFGLLGSYCFLNRLGNIIDGLVDDQNMPRRGFLKGVVRGGKGAAGMALATNTLRLFGGKISDFAAVHQSSEEGKDVWLDRSSHFMWEPDSVYADGRTGLLIAKNEDALDYLEKEGKVSSNAKGAAVMGFSHSGKGNIYLRDEKACNDAIYEYAKYCLEVQDLNPLTKNQNEAGFINWVLDNIAAIEVCRVDDPGFAPGTRLVQYVDKVVRPEAYFQSPRVEKAIASLRP